MKNFGEFLKQKRQEKNLTQKDLAKYLFVTESAISKWEKNVSRPDISLLPKLSSVLGVTEHELITASVDEENKKEKVQAKKWRSLVITYNLFFIISYGIAILTTFICNLAVNKTLSWFFIVLSAIILAFTLTTLPQFIKKYKLVLIPTCFYLALCLLLGVCCIYTNGNWFFVAILSVLLGLTIIFLPIIIAKYSVFAKIKNFNAYISVFADFILLNILLLVIEGYVNSTWYLTIAFPIALIVYLIINMLLSVKFIKINKLLKTSVILFLITIFIYLPPLFIKVRDINIQNEINDLNIFNASLGVWVAGETLDNNVHLIIFLTLILTSISFLISGIIKTIKNKRAK
ncbi:MAG: helix-turn-helix domain-containing protein [Clostridia bacterium]|nr:helix-turn-helix domain-containing protein [Clostridia bacterium]